MLVIFYVQFHAERVAAFQSRHRSLPPLLTIAGVDQRHLHVVHGACPRNQVERLEDEPDLSIADPGQLIVGQDRKIAALWHAFFLNVVDENFVQAFKADGIMLKNFRDVICSLVDAGISKHQQYALRIAVNQLDLGFKNCDAGALAANQSAGNVEATIFARQQLVEVVA